MRERWKQLRKNIGGKAYSFALGLLVMPLFVLAPLYWGYETLAVAAAAGMLLATILRRFLVEHAAIYGRVSNTVVWTVGLFGLAMGQFPSVRAAADQYEPVWLPVGFFVIGVLFVGGWWVLSDPDVVILRRDHRVIQN